jgi:hypothetical protein
MGIKEREDELFKEWRKKRPEFIACFIADGVVNETEFEKGNPKIVFLLKETNNFEYKHKDLRVLLKDGHTGKALWNNVVRWTMGIRAVWNGGEPINIEKISQELRKEHLNTIAAVNVKKITGGSRAKKKEISQYLREDSEFILRQLAIYDADVVILGGVDYPKPLERCGKANTIKYGYDGKTLVLTCYHPAYAERCERLVDGLVTAIKEIRAVNS